MKIAVAGTGYVGLVAGVCFAEVGHHVTCVDVDEEKVKLMESGISPIYEEGLQDLMQKNYGTGRLHYTTDYQSAYRDVDAIFIGVGTPEMPDGSANLDYIATVSRQIAESVERDCLVVVKSTVPVGTNDKVEQFIHDFLKRDVKIEVAARNAWVPSANSDALGGVGGDKKMGKKRTRPTARSTIDKKHTRGKPKSRKERIGQPTGLLDCEGEEIMTGDFVRLREAGYSGPVMWHSAWGCYGLFMGLWYGDKDPYNPNCYGKCIEIPADNGMRMSIERVKQKGRQK